MNLGTSLDSLTQDLDNAINSFVTEMKIQGIWDDGITVVGLSEFGRTLTTNTGEGSDHAWGGNAFALGGSLSGKRILGQYPDDLSTDSPINVSDRGVLIPTTPFESIWNEVAQWFGVTRSDDLNYVLPNRHSFEMFGQNSFYDDTTTSRPTMSSSPTISILPTISPSMSNLPTFDNFYGLDFEWFIPGEIFQPQTVIMGDSVRFNWSGTHDGKLGSHLLLFHER